MPTHSLFVCPVFCDTQITLTSATLMCHYIHTKIEKPVQPTLCSNKNKGDCDCSKNAEVSVHLQYISLSSQCIFLTIRSASSGPNVRVMAQNGAVKGWAQDQQAAVRCTPTPHGRRTDRQTDRQAGRQADRQTDRQADRHVSPYVPSPPRCPCLLQLLPQV